MSAESLRLVLYVAGTTPASARARANLRELVAEHLAGEPPPEVVDVLVEPLRALEDGVFLTPALVRLQPEPRRLVFGDLSDRAAVLAALGLEP